MLHKACDYGHLDIVEYLIQNGADINVSHLFKKKLPNKILLIEFYNHKVF